MEAYVMLVKHAKGAVTYTYSACTVAKYYVLIHIAGRKTLNKVRARAQFSKLKMKKKTLIQSMGKKLNGVGKRNWNSPIRTYNVHVRT